MKIELHKITIREVIDLNASGAYAGADYFKYKGKKLRDLPDIGN